MNKRFRKISKDRDYQKQQKGLFFMRSLALANYAMLCVKLKEVPREDVIKMLEDCEEIGRLIESNKIFTSHLK